MKKNLIALSMMATAGLFAESGNAQPMHQQSGYCNTCCCTPCCCKPCCVPQPKKCIDCECYVPAFYDLQCDWGFFASVDFLYWYASEANLPFAAKIVTQSSNAILGEEIPSVAYIDDVFCVGSSWDPGVRVGLGWNSDCDGWDIALNWTYFKNSTSKTAKVEKELFGFESGTDSIGVPALLSPWVASLLAVEGELSNYFDSVRASWKVRFNQVDLTLGKKYWLSPCFALRPFLGIRGAWTRTNYNLRSQNGPSPTEDTGTSFSSLVTDNLKNRDWGVGILTGIQPTWYFCSNFALYGNLGLAAIWGASWEKKGKGSIWWFY